MIRLQQLTVENFRGIRNLTVDLNEGNFVICGPNGTGKSGIVDAIEFVLTGDISRLSGKGTGVVSVKAHAPHVDERLKPNTAVVRAKGVIVSSGKSFSIERSVGGSGKAVITPSDADVEAVLASVALHPEFVLSRRELINYVLATPGDRATEIQALLRLDKVEKLRLGFQRIVGREEKDEVASAQIVRFGVEALSEALGLDTGSLNATAILLEVNSRRAMLGLESLPELAAGTSLVEGIKSGGGKAANSVPKTQTLNAVSTLSKYSEEFNNEGFCEELKKAREILRSLCSNPGLSKAAEKERFLETAKRLIVDEYCPVCETEWDPAMLREKVKSKLDTLQAVSAKRIECRELLNPLVDLFSRCVVSIDSVIGFVQTAEKSIDIEPLRSLKSSIVSSENSIKDLGEYSEALQAINRVEAIQESLVAIVKSVKEFVQALPDPSAQDQARDFLVNAQAKLHLLQQAKRTHAEKKKRANLSKQVSETFVRVSNKKLDSLYRDVEGDFSDLYRYVNREDEDQFKAELRPSSGKLGFDVDFYGRGLFPPGAYHSEGHQDGMGLCLYLALMKFRLKEDFGLAVLDDVLMSVDSGHRREVCNLLKKRFPNTQFIMTTHDEIWLRQLQTTKLVSRNGSIHFRTWTVDVGPNVWKNADVWKEIKDALDNERIREAAGVLRQFLEHFSREVCNSLRAHIVFRADANYDLGGLLPNATGQYKKLLIDAAASERSWGRNDTADSIDQLRKDLRILVASTQMEQWVVNPAMHYNEWASFRKSDFVPVVDAFEELIERFYCSKCSGLIYLVTTGYDNEELRCQCKEVSFNLRRKKQ